MSRNAPDQTDLFDARVFQSRPYVPQINFDRFRYRLKQSMSAVLNDRNLNRHQVAADMARMLGIDSMSKGMLDAYTSPAKDADITLVRFKAFTRAAKCPEIWDHIISDEGLLVLQQDEARLAEIARLQQEKRRLNGELRALMATPVKIERGQ